MEIALLLTARQTAKMLQRCQEARARAACSLRHKQPRALTHARPTSHNRKGKPLNFLTRYCVQAVLLSPTDLQDRVPDRPASGSGARTI